MQTHLRLESPMLMPYAYPNSDIGGNMPNEKRDVATILRFVERTVQHGVPVRVALQRAEKRFGMNRSLIRSFYRGDQ